VLELVNRALGRRQHDDRGIDHVLTLRVLAFRRRGKWYAQCLDLNLMTSRPGLESALAALAEQIQLYVETALEANEWEQRIPRPAPFENWVAYYCASILQDAAFFLKSAHIYTTFRMPFDQRGHLIGA
jgi:predicted RNase H-like HicB family nuclease